MSQQRRAWIGVTAAVLLTGCGTTTTAPEAISTTSAAPPASSSAVPAITAPRMINWIDLKVGDCLAELPPTDPAVVTVTVVDCAAPHLAETFLRADIPVNAAVTDTANQQCAAGLSQYTRGAAGNFTISYLIDSQQDRTDNNPYPSTVICLLQSAAGESLRGSARLN